MAVHHFKRRGSYMVCHNCRETMPLPEQSKKSKKLPARLQARIKSKEAKRG